LYRYELTDRGKFYIAVLLIIILLVILALTLVVWASSRNNTPEDGPNNNSDGIYNNNADPDGITDGSDSEPDPEPTPDGAQSLENGDNGDPEEPSVTDPEEPLLNDTATLDIEAGILTFLFTPATQTALEDSTFFMLGELVASPQYSQTSIFAVDIPLLPDAYKVNLTTAITEAFTILEVPLGAIVFFTVQVESDDGTFEIRISMD